MHFNTAPVWACHLRDDSLVMWCSRFEANADDWLSCISGSMALVAEGQRHALEHLATFCSQLSRAPTHEDIKEIAISTCQNAATSYISGLILQHIYPIGILERSEL